MSAVLLIARLALAAVFAVAGAAKLADLPGSRRAVAAFGVPAGLAGVVGVVLPLAELAVAVLLLPEATAWWGALGALLLLLLFCAAIGISLARGQAPDCHCFGQLHSAPAGRGTLLRNGALAAVALFVLVAGFDDAGPGALEWIGDLEGSELLAVVAVVVALVAVAACAALALRLLRAHGRLLLRIDALEQRLRMAGFDLPDEDAYVLEETPLTGEPAPPFALPALDGSTVTLEDLLADGRPALLVFSDPGCGPCQELAPDVAGWQQTFAEELEVVVVSGGSGDDVREKLGGGRPERTLLERDRDVALSVEYGVNGTPGAVLVGADGIVVAGPAGGRAGVEHLLGHGLALARGQVDEPAGGLEPGTEAPSLVLSALEGGEVEVAAPRPAGAVVLFWNPDCGFCRQLHPALRAWEEERPAGAPDLLVVSSSTADSLTAEGFRSTVLQDPGGSAMEAFGASGTPMAVRLDAGGLVASHLAAGGDAVLALLDGDGAPTLAVHRRGPARAST